MFILFLGKGVRAGPGRRMGRRIWVWRIPYRWRWRRRWRAGTVKYVMHRSVQLASWCYPFGQICCLIYLPSHWGRWSQPVQANQGTKPGWWSGIRTHDLLSHRVFDANFRRQLLSCRQQGVRAREGPEGNPQSPPSHDMLNAVSTSELGGPVCPTVALGGTGLGLAVALMLRRTGSRRGYSSPIVLSSGGGGGGSTCSPLPWHLCARRPHCNHPLNSQIEEDCHTCAS
jgi:hypothetical protein